MKEIIRRPWKTELATDAHRCTPIKTEAVDRRDAEDAEKGGKRGVVPRKGAKAQRGHKQKRIPSSGDPQL
jgi:hypothetical protein